MEALSGTVPFAGGAGLGAGSSGGKSGGAKGHGHHSSGGGLGVGTSREDVVFQQRRGRAWRLLVAQAGLQVTIPGVQGPAAGPMKLIECLGR